MKRDAWGPDGMGRDKQDLDDMGRDARGRGTGFDGFGEGVGATPGTSCYVADELRADALDGALSAPEESWFDAHRKGCPRCAASFADAERGLHWLSLLKTSTPEPAADLVERILAQTSLAPNPLAESAGLEAPDWQIAGRVAGRGAASPQRAEAHPFAPVAAVVPATSGRDTPRGKLLRFPLPSLALPRFGGGAGYDSRLAMTAAMAFFSIALTLSLSGVRLDQIQTARLTPRGVEKTFYEADARVVRFYDGLRVVRSVESRLSDLRDARGAETAPQRGGPAEQQGTPGGTTPTDRKNDAPGGVSQENRGAGTGDDRLVGAVGNRRELEEVAGRRFIRMGPGSEGAGV